MLWDHIDGTVWDAIKSRKTTNPEFVFGEPVTGGQENPIHSYIFISSDRAFHLIVSTNHISDNDLIHPNAAGLKIIILQNHLISGVPRQNYIDVFCSGRHHIEPFTEIVKEICQNIFEKNFQSIDAVNKVIRKWKSFWGKPPGIILGIDEQVGLIGELHILEYLITQNLHHIVDSWNNPLNLIHDFEFENFSLEIKTTRNNNHRHIINGLDQLETLPERTLTLFSVVALEENNGISLTDKIAIVFLMLHDRPDQQDLFFDRLSKRGYRPEHEGYYDQNRFRLTDIRVFQINNNFPRLVRSSLIHPLPVNISTVRYTLELEGLDYGIFDSMVFNEIIPGIQE